MTSHLSQLDSSVPLELHQATVVNEWLDEYEHMNLAYYVMICDQATYAFWEMVNGDSKLADRNGLEYAVVETHVNYLQEVQLHDPLAVTTQLLDVDAKRFHIYHELRHRTKGFVSATNEVMALSFNLNSRKAVPFKPPVAAALNRLFQQQQSIPRPANAGRSIGMRRNP